MKLSAFSFLKLKGATRILPVLGAVLVAAAAHGQVAVNANPGTNTTSLVTGATTVNFDEVAAATYTGTTYTSPAASTQVEPGINPVNGQLNIAGLTPASGGTPGSFVSGGSSGVYADPTAGGGGTYLAIGATGRPGPLTLTFSKGGTAEAIQYFGLYLGSPDSFNQITFTFKSAFSGGTGTGGNQQTITATQGTASDFIDFNATAANPIVSIQLAISGTNNNAFESDNYAFSVPEPATWLGAALLLGGAGLLARRRFSVAAV